jgi:hypothetical protein
VSAACGRQLVPRQSISRQQGTGEEFRMSRPTLQGRKAREDETGDGESVRVPVEYKGEGQQSAERSEVKLAR